MKFGEHEVKFVSILRMRTGGRDIVRFDFASDDYFETKLPKGTALEWLFETFPGLDVPIQLDDYENGIHVTSNLRLLRKIT